MKSSSARRNILFVLLALLAISWFSQIYSTVLLPTSTVSIVQSSESDFRNIQEEEIDTMVRNAVALAGGLEGIVKDGDSVVIKPNMVSISSGSGTIPSTLNGVTTDWRVTRTVVNMVRELNPSGKVYVMEGAASRTEPIMAHLGYNAENLPGVDQFICLDRDCGEWQDYTAPEIVNVSLPNGMIHTNYYLNRIYKEADVLISLPTMKNHDTAGITGALKNVGIGAPPGNIYGYSTTNPWKWEMVSHNAGDDDINKWIHDWNLCRPIDFAIMDGLVGLQNGPIPYGPLAREQMNMRLILASRDPVALDTIEGLIIGWDPESVNYLVYLNNSAQGNTDVSRIKVAGKRVDEVRKDFEGDDPGAGGVKITDKTAPSLAVASYLAGSGSLQISLNVEEETRKVEIYIDGDMMGDAITSGYDQITLDTRNLTTGTHEVTVRAYDRFLNQSSENFTFEGGEITPTPDPHTVSPISPGTTLETVYNGGLYYEGPLWDPVTEKLYFTTPNDAPYHIYSLDGQGHASVWMSNTSATAPNGLCLSKEGRMLIAEQDSRSITSYRIGANGPEDKQVLCSNSSWNRPNDLFQMPGGDIYFTGPNWGGSYQAVYHLSTTGEVQIVNTSLPKPNGLVGSMDGTKLYISDSDRRYWLIFDVNSDGTLGQSSVFFNPSQGNNNVSDGMTMDEFGNLYFCGKGGLWIVSPTGVQLDFISIPEFASNITFGGVDGKTLYITCDGKVYSLQTNVRGFRWAEQTEPLTGDVNDDSVVNIVDALMVAQYVVGYSPYPFISAHADVSGDGIISILDALMIAQYSVGLITGF